MADSFDWKGASAVLSGVAALQVPVAYGKGRYWRRNELIQQAQSLGLPYKVTGLTVRIGQRPHEDKVLLAVPKRKVPVSMPRAKNNRAKGNRPESGRVYRKAGPDID